MKLTIILHGHSFSADGDDVSLDEPMFRALQMFLLGIGSPNVAVELDTLTDKLSDQTSILKEKIDGIGPLPSAD